MDAAMFDELVDGDRAYKLSTLLDIVETAYEAGVRPREQHILPTFAPYPTALPRLLTLAYGKGLPPTDEHFAVMGARICPVKLIVLATSEKLAGAHGRGGAGRYRMKWDLHVEDRLARERADLLAIAYASGDIVPSHSRHLRPLGTFLGWRALAAAYKSGAPVLRRHIGNYGAVEGRRELSRRLSAGERAGLGIVIKAWVDAGVARNLAPIPVEWIGTDSRRRRVLAKMYAGGVVPLRSHLEIYGEGCATVVKKARVRFARARFMQRKCLNRFMHEDLSDIVMRMIKSVDLL